MRSETGERWRAMTAISWSGEMKAQGQKGEVTVLKKGPAGGGAPKTDLSSLGSVTA